MPRTLTTLLQFALFGSFVACGGLDSSGDPTVATSAIRGRTFTPEHVDEILTLLENADEAQYRVQLPVTQADGRVTQQSFGRLPMTEIRRRASIQGIRLDPTNNVLGFFSEETGGGAGSHTDAQDCNATTDQTEHTSDADGIGDLIGNVLLDIDSSQYQYIQ